MYLINFTFDSLKSSKYNRTKLDVNKNEPTKEKGDFKILTIILDL